MVHYFCGKSSGKYKENSDLMLCKRIQSNSNRSFTLLHFLYLVYKYTINIPIYSCCGIFFFHFAHDSVDLVFKTHLLSGKLLRKRSFLFSSVGMIYVEIMIYSHLFHLLSRCCSLSASVFFVRLVLWVLVLRGMPDYSIYSPSLCKWVDLPNEGQERVTSFPFFFFLIIHLYLPLSQFGPFNPNCIV